jgi:tetratricopeptide (TPR) repeat protein
VADDLVRVYARQLSDAHAETDGRSQAYERLFAYYLEQADAADKHLNALPGQPVPAQFTGRQDALAWLDAERASLIAAVTLAASIGDDKVALELPMCLRAYLSWRRRFDDWLAVLEISLDAARALNDRRNEATALTSLGLALVEVRRFDEAITALQNAAAIYRETGDRYREGSALNNLREARSAEES